MQESAPSTGHNLLEGALEKQREVGMREGMLGIEALVPMDGFGEQQVPYRQATRHETLRPRKRGQQCHGFFHTAGVTSHPFQRAIYVGDLSLLKMLPRTFHSPFTRVHASTNFPASAIRCPLGPSIPSW